MSSDAPFLTYALPVRAEDDGERLDRFLPSALERCHGLTWSRRAVRRAIDGGAVWLDGRRLRVASRLVRAGNVLEIRTLAATPPKSRVPELDPARILWHDEWLVVIDKPSGLPCQATPTDALGNALEAVRALLRRQEPGRIVEVELAHRLDRGTSGLLLLAKDRQSLATLSQAFAERRVEKRYQVLVSFEPGDACEEAWIVDSPLAAEGRRMVVDESGKSARTEFRRLDAWRDGAWLEARPVTGRKHQIRAHLAADHKPVVGDRLYGPEQEAWSPGGQAPPWPTRMMLHAASLRFVHPVTGEEVAIDCAPPRDFLEALARLRETVSD